MKRFLTAAAVLCIAVPVAFADKKSISDPKDSKGSVDIKTVIAGHDGSKLVHKVIAYGKIRKGQEPGLSVWAGQWDRVGGPSYLVTTFGVTNGRGETTGRVTVRRPNGRTVVYKFGKRAIGNPRSYRWRWCVCPERQQQDLAPKRAATHTLR